MADMNLHDYVKQSRGRASDLARAIDAPPSLISQWISIREVPPDKVLPIVKATDGAVTPFELRPDLYPDPDWLPPDVRKPRRKKAS